MAVNHSQEKGKHGLISIHCYGELLVCNHELGFCAVCAEDHWYRAITSTTIVPILDLTFFKHKFEYRMNLKFGIWDFKVWQNNLEYK